MPMATADCVSTIPTAGRETGCMMVYAKLMIVDDRVVRIASWNLSNRSIGPDSERDLCLVVDSESDCG